MRSAVAATPASLKTAAAAVLPGMRLAVLIPCFMFCLCWCTSRWGVTTSRQGAAWARYRADSLPSTQRMERAQASRRTAHAVGLQFDFSDADNLVSSWPNGVKTREAQQSPQSLCHFLFLILLALQALKDEQTKACGEYPLRIPASFDLSRYLHCPSGAVLCLLAKPPGGGLRGGSWSCKPSILLYPELLDILPQHAALLESCAAESLSSIQHRERAQARRQTAHAVVLQFHFSAASNLVNSLPTTRRSGRRNNRHSPLDIFAS